MINGRTMPLLGGVCQYKKRKALKVMGITFDLGLGAAVDGDYSCGKV
jgi:hypothetical protein